MNAGDAVGAHAHAGGDRSCERCAASALGNRAVVERLGLAEETVAQIQHGYNCERLSLRRIAAQTGIRRERVTEAVRALGFYIAPRGVGRPRAWTRLDDCAGLRDTLVRLYCRERRTSAEIGRVLGMDGRTVRNRLREHGIRRRTKGRFNREDRRDVDPDELRHLAVDEDLSVREISARTGMPYPAVLRAAHDLGLPVRLGGQRPRNGPRDIELLYALYADPLVQDAVRRFGLPAVEPGAPLWRRFPVPVALNKRLLAALYSDCGLSTHQIELLTGQPSHTVLRHLRKHGIPRRPPGGRAPFWSRWRSSH